MADPSASPAPSGAHGHEPAVQAAAPGKPKTVIANFEILDKLGQGGMGAVFRARQITMDRIVAVKILPPKLAQDPVFKQRFLQEARLSAKLSHLNIINGIDCGEVGQYTYFAMEFVDGKTLKQILQEKKRLPPAEAFDIVYQMAEALVYAEAHKLVHRDIKPENIMLTAQGVAKLCDLGLAKQIAKPDEASLTQAGQAVGTPHYIAPEQARGEHVDTRSDIYALGATFYHLLTGKTPFDGPTGAVVMALHITDEAKIPCDVDPLISTHYGEIISKMMAKSVAERYATAQDLLNDLDAVKHKRVPKAVAFRAKTSCALPRRVQKPAGEHHPAPGEHPHRAPTGPHPATPSRIPLVAAAAVLLLIGGGVVWKLRGRTDNTLVVAEPKKNSGPLVLNAVPPVANNPSPPKDTKAASPAPPPITKKTLPLLIPPRLPNPNQIPPLGPPPEDKKEISSQNPPDDLPPPALPKVPLPPAKRLPPPPRDPALMLVSSTPLEAGKNDPLPKIEPNADMLYARFLSAYKDAGTKDLQKFIAELRDTAAKPEFNPARADVNAELEDADAALKFEQQALKSRAEAGGYVDLNDETAKKWGAKRGKIKGYDPNKGLSIEVNQAGFFITAAALPMSDILKNASDRSPLAQARYLCIRGDIKGVPPYIAGLQEADKTRWERKLKLLAGGEQELRAQAALDNLSKAAEAKKWGLLNRMIADFEKSYGNSVASAERVVQLQEWKSAVKAALAPVNGWEAGGNWAPVPKGWNNTGPITIEISGDAGNKVLVLEAPALGPAAEKSAGFRTVTPPPDLTGKTRIVFRARHNLDVPVPIALGFFTADEIYFETVPVESGAGGWHENTVRIDGPYFKSGANAFLAYNLPLFPREGIKRFVILVYAREAYKLEVDAIEAK